jgi:hypothetical protein
MPRIIVQVSRPSGGADRVTLSERVVAANLDSEHYVAQLLERIAWATADAEQLESSTFVARRDQSLDTETHPDRPVLPEPSHVRAGAGAGAGVGVSV